MTYPHLHERFHEVMARSDKERLDFLFEERWIAYGAANAALETMKRLFDLPPSDRMPGLLLVSDGFNGKTKILSRFYELYGQGYVNERAEPVKPIISTQSLGSNEKRLYISILERFHAPYNPNDSAAKLYYQVLHQCRACHVKMLFIDEIHDLLKGSRSAQSEIVTAIKHLSTEIKIPVIGAGTKEAVRALHMTDQLATRFDVVTLPLWQLDAAFQQLLAGIERTLPLKKASLLSKPELASAIYGIAGRKVGESGSGVKVGDIREGGRVGDVRRFVQELARQAIESGEEQISLKLVEKNRKWKRPSDGIRELIG